MPVFKDRTVIELAKNLTAYLNLDVGLTRGPAPDYERALAQARSQAQQAGRQLRRLKESASKKDRELQRLRGSLSEKDRQISNFKQEAARLNEVPEVVKRFHQLYYDSGHQQTWKNTYWQGVPIQKNPLDLWIYQEMIFDLRPDVIVECGTALGGSALFLACMCDLVDKGEVVTIDVEDIKDRPRHERIHYLLGSSTAEDIVERVRREHVKDGRQVLVILDSDHSKDHVLEELRTYGPFVPKGGYVVVEDTNVNGFPVRPDFGPGPMEAVREFLKEDHSFDPDGTKEKFFLTFNPKGYLKRVV